jgi:hypothetical protein
MPAIRLENSDHLKLAQSSMDSIPKKSNRGDGASGGALKYGDVGRMTETDTPKRIFALNTEVNTDGACAALDDSLQGQDVQHQLADGMKVVLPSHVGLKRHAAVGKKHGPGGVTTLALPELFVRYAVRHPEVFGCPLRPGSLPYV